METHSEVRMDIHVSRFVQNGLVVFSGMQEHSDTVQLVLVPGHICPG